MNKAVKRIIIGCNLALAIVGLIGAILAVILQRGAGSSPASRITTQIHQRLIWNSKPKA